MSGEYGETVTRRQFLKDMFFSGLGTAAAYELLTRPPEFEEYRGDGLEAGEEVPGWPEYVVDDERYWYPFDVFEESCNDVDVTLVGVEHTPAQYDRFEEFYSALVESHDAVVVEQPVHFQFYEGSGFYGKLGEEIWEADRDAYVADPVNKESFIADLFQGSFGAVEMYRGADNGSVALSDEEAGRGEFLTEMGRSLAGMYLFVGSFFGFLTQAIVDREGVRDGSGFEQLDYGGLDFRNVMIAEGIDRITAEEDVDSLVAFHGDAHTEQISAYLEDGLWRDVKRGMYIPHRLLGRKSLRKFSPRPSENKWKEDVL